MTGQRAVIRHQATWVLGLVLTLFLAPACGGRGGGDAASGGASSSSSESDSISVCNGDPRAVPVKSIATGKLHTCILTSSGGVRCWGNNSHGQLGDGTTTSTSTPPSVDVITGVRSIAAGGVHTCVLMTAGDVRCWGSNASGQLGDGTSEKRQPSAQSAANVLGGVSEIAPGWEHTCARKLGGVKCWGGNDYGQLGNGTTTDSPIPPNGDVLTGVSSIKTGGAHTCALTTTNDVRCWGTNAYGQLGYDSIEEEQPLAQSASNVLGSVSDIAAGWAHSCALLKNGGVRCWGINDKGQLGNGTTAVRRHPPETDALTGVSALVAGWEHTCALMGNGGVRCWGANASGQIGDGTTTDRLEPPDSDVFELPSVKVIAAGGEHTCALTRNGGVRCWGANDNGQLGVATAGAPRLMPTVVKGFCPD